MSKWLRRERVLIFGALGAVLFVAWRNWPAPPKPYYAEVVNIITALRAGDFEKFERALAADTLKSHRLDRSTLQAVFEGYLSPLYKQGSIRPFRTRDDRTVGNGTAHYWMKLPGVEKELRIGCTAFYDGKASKVLLEHIVLQSFEIQAAKDGILHVSGGLQIRKYSPKLSALGMLGIANSLDGRGGRYFTWDEYAAAFDAMAEHDNRTSESGQP